MAAKKKAVTMGKTKAKEPEDKRPTNEQVLLEVKTLREMKPKIPHHSMFGDDNWAAIEAQAKVLTERMSEGRIYREFEEDSDPEDEHPSTHVLDSALDALHWLEGTENAPSKEWEGLVK